MATPANTATDAVRELFGYKPENGKTLDELLEGYDNLTEALSDSIRSLAAYLDEETAVPLDLEEAVSAGINLHKTIVEVHSRFHETCEFWLKSSE